MRIAATLALIILTAAVVFAQDAMPVKHVPELDRLRALVGRWQGKDPKGAPVGVSYSLVSNETALLETLDAGGHAASMVTMYHVDKGNLMATHYCSMGNQPRMKADPSKSTDSTLVFSFLDATNLKSLSEPHIHGLTLIFRGKDQFAQEWVMMMDGKEQREVFSYARVP